MADLDIEHLAARLAQTPDSPLFARLADLYLASDRHAEALALAERGVALYPSYAAGQIVLGRCCAQASRVREARAAFHRALDLSPTNAVAQHLLVSLPVDDEEMDVVVPAAQEAVKEESPEEFQEVSPTEEAAELSPALWQEEGAEEEANEAAEVEPFPLPPSFRASAETEFFSDENEDAKETQQEPEAPAFEPFPTFEEYLAAHPASTPVMSLDDYLKGRTASAAAAARTPGDAHAPTDFESLANRLQNAPRIVPAQQTGAASSTAAPSSHDATEASDESATSGGGAGIVTQTMAEIYASQNEFQAAIDAYQELIKRQPEQAEAFQQRIDAIRLLIGDQ